MSSLLLLAVIILWLKWHHIVLLQSIIILIANFLLVKILLHCFFGSSTCSCLYFLWFEWYFVVIFCTFVWSISSSRCFSFNCNIPSFFTIVSVQFLSCVFLLISTRLYSVFYRKFKVFYFFFHFIIFS